MKIKKLIWMLVFVFSIQIVTALPNATYELNNDVLDGTGSNDGTNSGVSFEAFVPDFNVSGNGSPTSGYYQTGGTDEFNINQVVTGLNVFTISMWVYFNASTCPDRLFGQGGSNNDRSIDFGRQGGDCAMTASYATTNPVAFEQSVVGGVPPTTTWHMWTLVRNTTRLTLYFNNTENSTVNGGTSSNTRTPAGGLAYVGEGMNVGLNMDNGYIDHVRIYTEALNPTEITNLWNCGEENVSDCSAAPPVVINESIERTFVDRQVGSIFIGGTGFTDVLSDSFTIDQNISHNYLGATINVLPSASNEIECRILVDGTDFDSVMTRTLTALELGSIYTTTSNISLTNGSHTTQLQCRRSATPGGAIEIFNSVLVAHFEIDEQNESVNTTYNITSFNVSNGPLTSLATFTHTTNNRSTDSSVIRALVIDWDATYDYNATNTITTQIQFDNFNCSLYPRFGVNLDLGSSGGTCVLLNASALTQHNISLLGNGSGTVTLESHVKEFLLDTVEINFTSLTGINLTNSTLVQVANISIENLNHDVSSFFIKAGIPISSNDGDTNANIQIRMSGDATDETQIYERTVGEDESGIVIVQDVFESIAQGSYVIEVWASCDNSNCTITGDDITAYITDTQAFTRNEFNVTAFNNFTLAALQDFNVSFNGAFVNTSNGVVSISTLNTTLDIIVAATNFFNTTVLAHNTSTNANVSMLPFTEIFVQDVAGNPLINFTVNFANINGNTSDAGTVQSNSSGIGLIQIFNATYTVNVTNVNSGGVDYATAITNLTASPGLQNHTFTVFRTNSFNLVFLDEQTRLLINGTNITVEFLSTVEALNFTTSNGTIFVSALTPAEVEIRYNADGFDQRSFFIFLQNQTFNNLTLYSLNESVSTQVLVKGLDENGIPVEGVIFQVKREYIIDAEVVFEIVEMDNSDFGGEAVFNLQLNEPNYKWLVVRNVTNNEVLFTSNAAEITSTTLTFFLNILADPLASFRVVTNLITGQQIIATRPVYDNTSKQWNATFEIPDATIVETVCLTVDQITNFGFLQVNQSCTTANTGLLTVGYDNDLLGSLAKLQLETTTKFSDYVLTSNTFSPTSGTVFGNAGVFIGVWIVSTFALAFLSNAALMVVATLIALTSISVLGIIGMTYLSFITLIITGGILLFSMRK